MTDREQIDLYLKDLPSEWRKDLTEILCQIKAGKQEPDCEKVQSCETVTQLSDFSVSGNTVSIRYTDEDSITVTRQFDVTQIFNEGLDDIQPNCLTSQSNWNTLTFQQRIQLLIDSHCDCCS